MRHHLLDASGNKKAIRISREKDFFYSSNISFRGAYTSYVNCQALTGDRLWTWPLECHRKREVVGKHSYPPTLFFRIRQDHNPI